MTDQNNEDAKRQTIALVAANLMAAGQFTDNQIPQAVQRAKSIVEETWALILR
jgi:hypothetical protein